MMALTPREMAVAGLLADGKSNAEISDDLHISVGTVKLHVSSVLKKLCLKGREELLSKRFFPSPNGSFERNATCASRLTSRESCVIDAIARGLSNKEIARELSILEGTVKTHAVSINKKLEVKNRRHAAIRVFGIR